MFTKGGLHGAFVTVAEDCMVKAYDEKSPGKAPVLPTFCVESIEETLKVVESKGGRLHVYVHGDCLFFSGGNMEIC